MTEYFHPLTHEEDMPINFSASINQKYFYLESIFNSYYPPSSLLLAKNSSLEEQNQRNLTSNSSFIYGEITFRSVAYIIEYIKSKHKLKKGNFLDLGSGTGKAMLAAAMVHPFKKCVGIEYLKQLHLYAVDMVEQYERRMKGVIEEYRRVYFKEYEDVPKMVCVNGDFLKEKWEEACLILANSTCFTQELFDEIGVKAEFECREGTVVVTFSKRLALLSSDWVVDTGFRRVMTWGVATVYVHVRKKRTVFG